MDIKIFDSLLEPTFIVSSSGQIFYCNEPAALLTGLTARKLMRQKPLLTEVFQFSEPLVALQNLQDQTEASPYQEVRFTTTQQGSGRVQVTLQAFGLFESEPAWLVYMRDVTLEETLQRKYRQELEQKEGYISELEKAKEQLADYSRNLEIKVQERTQELADANRMMKALMDSLGQGFFIFNQQGRSLDIATRACEDILEKDPRGKDIWDVLNLNAKSTESFKKWMVTAFAEMLPFEDLAPLAPSHFEHSANRSIQLNYHPLRSDENEIVGIVVVATDITELVQAQAQAQKEKANAQLVLKLVHNKKQFSMFYREAHEWVDKIKNQIHQKHMDTQELFRSLHSLKGGAASFALMPVAEACHKAETILAQENISDTKKQNQLSEACGLIESAFSNFKLDFEELLKSMEQGQGAIKEIPEDKLIQFGERLLNHQPQLQHHFYFEFLFESLAPLIEPLNNPWAEVAGQLGKEVEPIEFVNHHLPLWSQPYEPLLATLIHAVRNAADHGIEMPEERLAKGKSRAGHLKFELLLQGNTVQWILSDDGAGINPTRIREKLKSQGKSNVESLSDQEVIQHIFDSQLSTKEQVSDISGRGVGMDAIQAEATRLGGKAWVKSTVGQGTQLFIEVPYLTPAMSRPGLKSA